MSDIFKSAFGYFTAPAPVQPENSFVGQAITISNVELRIKKVIAEGGFAVVFVAQDVNTSKDYALKRLLAADEEAKRNIITEINILRKLSGHPNIIQYLSTAFIDKTQTNTGQHEFLLVTELCTGGSLVDILQARTCPLDADTICGILYQTCRAVAHMHNQTPPIIHRDIKIENLLIAADHSVKLCDFGSATMDVFKPDISWSTNQRSTLEENLARFTTPMYRAPEMVDTWSNYFVGPPVDVWAIGCILYTLCYMKHPFEDGAKLRIINGNYTLTPDARFNCFHDTIRGCLQVNPEHRLNVTNVLDRLAAIAETNGYNLRAPLHNLKPQQSDQISGAVDTNGSTRHCAPPIRPQQPAVDPKVQPTSAGIFSSFRGGLASNILKNLKDTSSKVMQTVQQSIARTDLDLHYLTARIVAMSFPSEGIESAYRMNHMDDVRAHLESRHLPAGLSIYNLSGRSYAATRFRGDMRVVDAAFAGYADQQLHHRAPLLNAMYHLCEDLYETLAGDSRNTCVLHCMDGKASTATMFCALTIYAGLFQVPEDAMQMFAVKRCPPNMSASDLRYLYYLVDIVNNPQLELHYRPFTLFGVEMSPVPLFTKLRDGCRPYIEIYSENRCILSTLQEYTSMTTFNSTDTKCVIPLTARLCGDVCIVINHARNVLGGVMNQGKATGIKICQIQFHTGFVPENESALTFNKCDLDCLSEGQGHYEDRFTVTCRIYANESERKPTQPAPWLTDKTRRIKDTLFGTQLEMDEAVDNFVSRPSVKSSIETHATDKAARPPRPAPPSPRATKSAQLLINNSDHEDSNDSDASDHFVQHDKQSVKRVEEAVDLLNLNSASAEPLRATVSSNFDLLGGLVATVGDSRRDTSSGDDVFDPFGMCALLPQKGAPPTPAPGDPAKVAAVQLGSDYSRAHFDGVQPPPPPPPPPSNNGCASGVGRPADVFGDLLGAQGYAFTARRDNSARSLNAMRKEELAKDMDPEKMKILDWLDGKKHNIRALLCTMHTIMWQGAKWNRCEMHQLVTPTDVKKAYRKACLAAHPDKQVGTENENLANLIFVELNNAWSDFEDDASQQNMFNS